MKYRLKVLPSLNRIGMRILIFLVYTLPVVFGHFKHLSYDACKGNHDEGVYIAYWMSFWLYNLLLYAAFIFYYGYGHPEKRKDRDGDSSGFYGGLCTALPLGNLVLYAIVAAIYMNIRGLM